MAFFHKTYSTVKSVRDWIQNHLLLEGEDLVPEADGSSSLGSNSKEFKDIHIDGIAYLDALNIDNITSKTANYTAETTDRVILADTSGGAFTITLPAVADAEGMVLTVIRTGAGANAVTLDGDGAETIDGAATYTALDAQYDTVTLLCDGTEWFIIASKVA